MKKASYHPIDIGNVHIPGNLVMAPLAGYTDPAFRTIMRLGGADYAYTEMVSAEAIARNNETSVHMLYRSEGEDLLGVQLFLSAVDQAERALDRVLEAKPTTIDINVGCPVPKVVHTGAGSALLKEPARIAEIVSFLAKNAGVPVSVKFRTGWDAESVNYLEVADAALGAGASLLCLHGRTKKAGYSGTADWAACGELVDYVERRYQERGNPEQGGTRVPVLVSGDLFDPEAIVRMLGETGADGALVARGAMGNPWIFNRTKALLETGELPPAPSPRDCGRMALLHLALCIADKGEASATKEMRKQVPSYFAGFPGASEMRRKIVRANSMTEYKEVLTAMLGPELYMDKDEFFADVPDYIRAKVEDLL